MKQSIRIIGGQFRGKKIQFPEVEGLRPTPDRVRETLFNWLMKDIKEARCLDAFAGSGALGLEAFSRGATQVVFLEQSPLAHASLRHIISQFNQTALKLVKADTLSYLQKCTDQFDIIFLDPPFAKNYIPQCIDIINQKQLLPQGGLVYIESPTTIELDEQHWQQLKLKQAGQVIFGLFQKL
ncbi:16S rRNA (guanine(966)-N(2))-methyltransferase RsmD [Legionella quateirensis]|uniref:Ribosomal RNA small subunit methyltransferase D n=1 Tax=Legionella quateirensis TaxID=45072 RepID=A0A378KXP1_9GAMM|nr:16S rRNA (guanine(966)-N(2))-methyltransferase RsmD [Legionella quateirensis]KTD52747.1 putative methylase [Legionella quateirensis]STY19166.1 putative methylase [Legionella quateirensis]